jgi:putative hydrolase of the HAD superfamily
MSPDPGSSPVRAVFFDLAGTLIKVRRGIGAQYAAIARDYGVNADAAALDSAFPSAFSAAGRMVFARPDAAEAASLEKGFWKEVVRLAFAESGALAQFPPRAFDRCFDRLFHYFETAAPWAIYPDVLPVLAELDRRGFVLGLITNFDYRVFKLIAALDLARFIDSITIPALAGAAKPASAIFEYALARHGLQPGEAVQVGDSLRDDVEGARAAGLRGVLLDRKGRVPRTSDYITSLNELRPLLGLRP